MGADEDAMRQVDLYGACRRAAAVPATWRCRGKSADEAAARQLRARR